MKTRTIYVADDGARFDDAAACRRHEALCTEVAGIMATLHPKPQDDNCSFSNGAGFIQHPIEEVQRARRQILDVVLRVDPEAAKVRSIAEWSPASHPSWAGRYISELSQPLWEAWSRLSCIDDRGREWGQPYYCDHPHEAKQVCLNSVQPKKA